MYYAQFSLAGLRADSHELVILLASVLAGWANSLTGQKLSNHLEACNPAWTDLLINSDHKPKTS